jgi:hypothetical protein
MRVGGWRRRCGGSRFAPVRMRAGDAKLLSLSRQPSVWVMISVSCPATNLPNLVQPRQPAARRQAGIQQHNQTRRWRSFEARFRIPSAQQIGLPMGIEPAQGGGAVKANW